MLFQYTFPEGMRIIHLLSGQTLKTKTSYIKKEQSVDILVKPYKQHYA